MAGYVVTVTRPKRLMGKDRPVIESRREVDTLGQARGYVIARLTADGAAESELKGLHSMDAEGGSFRLSAGSTITVEPAVERVYLIVHGEVEVGPGRFEKGVIRSTPCASVEEAEAKWAEAVRDGLYEEPFETYEVRLEGPTLGEALPVEPAGEDGDR